MINFLKGFEIPYLFPGAVEEREIVQKVSNFIKMGCSKTSTGRDVIFQAKKAGQDEFVDCFIECKLWEAPIGMSSLYEYYEKACKNKNPISIIVAKSFIELFEDPDAFQNASKKDNPRGETNKVHEDAADNKPPKSKRVKIDYIELLEKLWVDESNRINIYTVKFNESDLTFKYTALLESEKPVGVFLIVNSNFTPPKKQKLSKI